MLQGGGDYVIAQAIAAKHAASALS